MKVLLAIGAPHSSHTAVFNVLREVGLSAANPSRYEGQTPEVLHKLMLSTHEVDLSGPGALEPLKPGKLWSEMAVDLFMANINQPLWGWADHQSAVLMDFWAEFDPQVRFVLCYDDPHAYVANTLAGVARPAMEMVEAALSEWSRWNLFLLNHFHHHRERCLLVNSQEALRNPGRVLQLVGLEWQWTMGDSAAAHAVSTDLPHYLARGFIPADHVSWALADKLNAEAQVPAAERLSPTAHLQAAWTDWVGIRERIATHEADQAQIEALKVLNAQNEELQRSAKAEIEQLRLSAQSAEADKLSQQIAGLAAKIESGSLENIRAAELVMENEHLMVALHQAQEEVENLVLRGGAAAQAGPEEADPAQDPEAVFVNPVDEIVLDMREPINGANWYGAEADGRWAGPDLESSIDLPPVLSGKYALELHLADAIASDIVYGLRIVALGADVPFEFSHAVTPESFPVVCSAQFDVSADAAEKPWSIGLAFPRTVSPADSGSNDSRRLALRVSRLHLKRSSEI